MSLNTLESLTYSIGTVPVHIYIQRCFYQDIGGSTLQLLVLVLASGTAIVSGTRAKGLIVDARMSFIIKVRRDFLIDGILDGDMGADCANVG